MKRENILFLLFFWFVSFVWLNQIKRKNQIDQTNQTNETNQINVSRLSRRSRLSRKHKLHDPGGFVTNRHECCGPETSGTGFFRNAGHCNKSQATPPPIAPPIIQPPKTSVT